ncbi:hypothetical protein D3C85_1678470 [compost metagenome]
MPKKCLHEELLVSADVCRDDAQKIIPLARNRIALKNVVLICHELLKRFGIFLAMAFEPQRTHYIYIAVECQAIGQSDCPLEYSGFLQCAHSTPTRRGRTGDCVRQGCSG